MDVSPERAAYEADPWRAPDIAWEELFNEDKEKYRGIAQAVIKASPELAELRAELAKVQRRCELLDELLGGRTDEREVLLSILDEGTRNMRQRAGLGS